MTLIPDFQSKRIAQDRAFMSSFKIAFIGAGSIGFTRTLLRDLLAVQELRDIEIAFTDINAKNLDMVYQLCQRDIKENGLKIKITKTTNRREALKNAKYIICTVRIGGLEAFTTDIDIPLKYGVDQCVGDTLCAGGLMYAQRGIAAMLDFCKDIREVAAPKALLLNYANPMAMMTWACNVYGGVDTVGLCHGVQHGHTQIATVLGLKPEEVDYVCAGINHQTWYTRVEHKGKDLTGKLLAAFEKHPGFSKNEKVRIDMLRRFGYYSTESNGHLSEYLPWYRKRPSDTPNWICLDSWINGETGGYLRICTEGRSWFETDFPNWMKGDAWPYDPAKRSNEHGSFIIEALETGRIYRGHFNRVNDGTITNLPEDAIIEAPGYVDRLGIHMTKVGDLPLGCAAVCNSSVQVQRLGVLGAVTGNIDYLRQAMLLDPLVGAVCNPPEVWQMTDELLVAQAKWLPQYKKAIVGAKARLAKGPRIKTGTFKGVARIKIKSVKEMAQDKAKIRKQVANTDKAADIH